MFQNRHELLSEIQPELIAIIIALLKDKKAPHYIELFVAICTCHGQPMPDIQQVHILRIQKFRNF